MFLPGLRPEYRTQNASKAWLDPVRPYPDQNARLGNQCIHMSDIASMQECPVATAVSVESMVRKNEVKKTKKRKITEEASLCGHKLLTGMLFIVLAAGPVARRDIRC